MNKTEKKKNSRGAVLPFVLLVLSVTLLLGAAMLRSALSARQISNIYTARAVATMAADSALDLAMETAYYIRSTENTDMLEEYDPDAQTTEVSSAGITPILGGGIFGLSLGPASPFASLENVAGWVYTSDTMTLHNSSKPAQCSYKFKTDKEFRKFEIVSYGNCMNQSKEIYAELILRGPYFGIGTKNGFILNVETNIQTVPADAELELVTNSIVKNSVVLKNGVVVPGDIVIGPGANPDEVVSLASGATVTGTISSNYEKIEFPSVSAPLLSSRAWPAPDPATGKITITESGTYPGYSTGNGEEIVVEGNVTMVVAGDLRLKNSASLTVASGSSLDLYLKRALTVDNSAVIQNANFDKYATAEAIRDATRCLKIFGTGGCDSIDLKNDSELAAAIYAPNAILLLHNQADFYGAVLGGLYVDIRNSGTFYFVEDLYEHDDTHIASLKLNPGSWREK
ncbi:DUF7305 domain-containing protein [Limihaloglobus sulfuriphilus]|nr:hypothetical protein [Limihaloglobus sulfuriphilus]